MSKENAKQFYEDSARDAIGLLDLSKNFVKSDNPLGLKNERDRLLALSKEDEISNPESYTRVSAAAKAIGFNNFPKLNMMFSKFAHPTALVVFSGRPQDKLLVGVRDLFNAIGTGLFTSGRQSVLDILSDPVT